MGGFTAAVLTIPVSMGYGLLALSALGDAHIPTAILAGLYAPVFGCIVAVLLGANTTMIYSPRSIVTFLIGSIVLHNLVNSSVPALQTASSHTLLVLALLLVFMAGGFQLLFGMLRLGSTVKYIPAPVIAGFQNAAAMLIFLSQLSAMLGLQPGAFASGVMATLEAIQPLTLLVGVATCMLILKGARITKSVPPTILGLIGGVALYYLFVLLGLREQLGPVIGAIPFAWPAPRFVEEFTGILASPQALQLLPVLLAGAASLAIVASLDGLLCARLVESDPRLRPGMFVQVELAVTRDSQVVTVPKDALYSVAGLNKVFIIRNDKAVECRIPPGLARDGWMEVPADKVKPGDTVAVSNLTLLSDGAAVQTR